MKTAQWHHCIVQNSFTTENLHSTTAPGPQALETAKLLNDYYESESHSVLSDSLWPHGLYSPWNSPCQNTRVGSLYLLQGIFPTLGLNPGSPHCRWILYQLSHNRSPRILEWVAYPFSSGSSWHRNQTGVSYIKDGFFTN